MNTSELKQTLVARACSYELAQAIADEIDRLRAENARQRAWIDGVMAQGAARVYGHDAYGFARIKFPGDEPKLGTELITRPATLEDK